MLPAAASAAYSIPFRFLDLPAEIRVEIYRHLLVLLVINVMPRKYLQKVGCICPYHKPCFDDSIIVNDFCIDHYEDGTLSPSRPVLSIDILCVNKQIHQEAVTVLYAENVFNLQAVWHYSAFLGSLKTEHANMITRVALEADGPLGYDTFLPFYHWYGRMDRVEEILKPSTDARTKLLLDKLHSIHLPASKRLEVQFQYGSTLMTYRRTGRYQAPDRSLDARHCEPWFQRKLADLDCLRKTVDEAAPHNDEHRQRLTKRPLPFILEVDHSEADSAEVVPGLRRRSDIHPGFTFEREDQSFDRAKNIRIKCCNVSLCTSNAPPRHHGGAEAVKQKLFNLNQAMLRRRDERVRQRVDRDGKPFWEMSLS